MYFVNLIKKIFGLTQPKQIDEPKTIDDALDIINETPIY